MHQVPGEQSFHPRACDSPRLLVHIISIQTVTPPKTWLVQKTTRKTESRNPNCSENLGTRENGSFPQAAKMNAPTTEPQVKPRKKKRCDFP